MTDGAGKRRIGVLGGMGPEATVLFMSRVIKLTPAQDDRDHVPLIVDDNTQVPSRIKALIEKTGEDPAPVLAEMARRLEAAGAEALAMPCNTAHHFAPAIVGAVDIPFLNMVDLAVERVAPLAQADKRVGLLASPAVRLTGLFDRAFAERGISTLYPADDDRLLAAICAIKVDSTEASAVRTLRQATTELIGKGTDVLVIACSEFSIIADTVESSIAVVDTIDVLAQAAIDFASHEDGGSSDTDGHWRMSA
ncbi:MAG: amino acid racemase [Pseudomonadota bacterium]